MCKLSVAQHAVHNLKRVFLTLWKHRETLNFRSLFLVVSLHASLAVFRNTSKYSVQCADYASKLRACKCPEIS